jgi:hypothetical protein
VYNCRLTRRADERSILSVEFRDAERSQNFQKSKGLRATGQLDERTINELRLDADEMRQGSQTRSDSSFSDQSYPESSGSEVSSGNQQYPGSSSESSFKRARN